MIDSYITIPDNVGTSFEIVDGNIVLGSPQSTFVGLSSEHIGKYIPYFIKNLLGSGTTEWETGIGKVISTTIVQRILVSKSSNNNNLVIFSFGGNKTFFVYPGEYSTNLAYNNLLSVSGIFNISNIRSTYLVDLSSPASGLLPAASISNRGLIVDFKTINRSSSNNLTIKPSGSNLIDGQQTLLINYNNAYTTLVSNGSSWTELKDNVVIDIDPGLLGTPQGATGSIQYKESSSAFGGAGVYIDSLNNSLSLGSSKSNPDIIISPSGDSIFNKNKSPNTDFIVFGSGNRNFIFDSIGRVAINMPSGTTPQSLLHMIGYACDSNIKLENRGSCTTPKITLYHKPPVLLSDNTEISSLILAAKNSVGSETEYAKLRATAISANSSSPSGSLVLSVNNGGSSLDCLNISPSSVILKNKDKQLSLSGSGVISDTLIATSSLRANYILGTGKILSITSGNILDSGFSVTELSSISGKASLSGCSFTGDISVPRILSASSSNSDPKMIDFDNLNIVGGWKLNNKTILSEDTTSSANTGRILMHTGSGIEWRDSTDTNLVWSNLDISWKKYPSRDCTIQNNGYLLVINNSDIDNEFFVNDTIKVVSSGIIYYRTINQISEIDNFTHIVISTPITGALQAQVSSVSRGGYLDLALDNSGAPSISPKTTISCRPGLSTSFNDYGHNIDFKIYGLGNTPAFSIKASGLNRSDTAVPVMVNSSTANIIDTANGLNQYASLSVSGYLYTDNIKLGSVSVPSGYILTSTSGNIASWQNPTTINSLDGGIVVFSGVSL